MIKPLTDAVSRLRQRRQDRGAQQPRTVTTAGDLRLIAAQDLWLSEQDVDQILEANDLADLDHTELVTAEPQSNEEQPQ
jgi:hypothetical protein